MMGTCMLYWLCQSRQLSYLSTVYWHKSKTQFDKLTFSNNRLSSIYLLLQTKDKKDQRANDAVDKREAELARKKANKEAYEEEMVSFIFLWKVSNV